MILTQRHAMLMHKCHLTLKISIAISMQQNLYQQALMERQDTPTSVCYLTDHVSNRLEPDHLKCRCEGDTSPRSKIVPSIKMLSS